MMQKDLTGFFPALILPALFLAAIYLAGLSTKANAGEEGATGYSNSTPLATPAAPVPQGKGPGMGRAYQRQTPGLGRGGPDYRGGYSSDPAYAPYTRETVPSGQGYGRPGYGPGGRGGRGYGYGYPGYRGQGGGGYPHHRQYGNPPPYPAATPPGEQAAPRQ